MIVRSLLSSGRLAAIALLGVFCASEAGPLFGQSLERPRRRPDGGAEFVVRIDVQTSHTPVATSQSIGTLWFERQMGNRYRGACDLNVTSRDAGPVPLPDFEFTTDADQNPAGEAERLGPSGITGEQVLRALSSSDLGLVPARVVLPHLMEFDSSRRQGLKQFRAKDGAVEIAETDLGIARVVGLTTRCYFTRIIRHLEPSGIEVHDYVFTCEDPDGPTVLAGYALRMLVHPLLEGQGGGRPESGVQLLAFISTVQRNWLREAPMLDGEELARLNQRFADQVENYLFDSLTREGIGDPFESPAATALRAINLLESKAVNRLVNIGHPKSLAITAPLLVGKPVTFDPATHLKHWAATNDPARRLLLAAGAACGGASRPEFEAELRLALHGRDVTVLRAATVLARALKDPALISSADQALARARGS